MEVTMKSLGQKEKVSKMPRAETKSVESFPEITVSSSQLKGLENAQLGKKCMLHMEAEVIELRKPNQWEIERGEGKDEVIARFKLKKGALVPMNGEKKAYNDFDDAKIAAEKEESERK